jgi:hypothetical protein
MYAFHGGLFSLMTSNNDGYPTYFVDPSRDDVNFFVNFNDRFFLLNVRYYLFNIYCGYILCNLIKIMVCYMQEKASSF